MWESEGSVTGGKVVTGHRSPSVSGCSRGGPAEVSGRRSLVMTALLGMRLEGVYRATDGLQRECKIRNSTAFKCGKVNIMV